jgi:hypothetical protein
MSPLMHSCPCMARLAMAARVIALMPVSHTHTLAAIDREPSQPRNCGNKITPTSATTHSPRVAP